MADPVHTEAHVVRPRPDDTPPRNRVIATYTVLAVITLAGLKFVFDSYMDTSRRAVRAEHISDSHTAETLDAYREQQAQRLSGGAMPIERAVQELGRRGRSAFPLIRPTPSEDLDPMRGWTQLPRELPAGAEPVVAPEAAAPEAAAPEAAAPEAAAPEATAVPPEGVPAPPPAAPTAPAVVPAEPAAGEVGAVAPAGVPAVRARRPAPTRPAAEAAPAAEAPAAEAPPSE